MPKSRSQLLQQIDEIKKTTPWFAEQWEKVVAESYSGNEEAAATVFARDFSLKDLATHTDKREGRYCDYCAGWFPIESDHWYIVRSPRYKDGLNLRCKRYHTDRYVHRKLAPAPGSPLEKQLREGVVKPPVVEAPPPDVYAMLDEAIDALLQLKLALKRYRPK